METVRRYSIHEFYFPVDGYTHYVQESVSVDGGNTFYYCGNGKYCHNFEEAKAVRDAMEKEAIV